MSAAPLLIDVGNTRTKWAIVGQDQIRPQGSRLTAQVTLEVLQALARKHTSSIVVVASVVPRVTKLLRQVFELRLHLVSSKSPYLDLQFTYARPSELGADRLAVAVGATGFPCLILACGTATAVTAIDAKRRVMGGVIAPGMQAQLDSLLKATAQLPATKLGQPGPFFAHSTREAIAQGVVLNFQGGIREIVAVLTKRLKLKSPPRIYLTGGNAKFVPQLPQLEHRPFLVLEGLQKIADRIIASRQK